MKKSSGRSSQLVRILNIIRDLSRMSSVDLYELAGRYGATTRTIRRDLDALREAGMPLTEQPSPDGRRKEWSLNTKDKLAKFASLIEASHYLSLNAALKVGSLVTQSSPLFASLEDLCEKIEEAIGPRQREELRAIDQAFVSHDKFVYKNSPPEILWPLVSAIAEKRICRVEYKAPLPTKIAKITKFRILPLRIFAHDGAAYLRAFVPRFENVILLNLHRLQNLTVTNETGSTPDGFQDEAWAASVFGIYSGASEASYKFRFSAKVAPLIAERIWHPTQITKTLEDGAVELSFSCVESYEVAKWVASWRSEVTVLSPMSLRKELAAVGQAWVQEYGEG
jgi:predicted DNA-binding transcriptional regulator YafY